MRDRVTWGSCTLLLAGALGCGPGEDISLGSETKLRVLADAGSGTDDSSSQSGPDTAYPPSPEAKKCTVAVEGEMAIDFQLDVVTPVCPAASACQLDIEQIVPTGDGTLWIRGTRWFPPFRTGSDNFVQLESSAWLTHIDADGKLLGTTEILFPADASSFANASKFTDFAVDDRGHAWLASWQNNPETGYSDGTHIQRFDATAQAVGEPIVLDDWIEVRMANVPGRGMAITGQRLTLPGRQTALLDNDGTLQWTRTESVVGLIAAPAVDPSGEIIIPSAAPGGVSSGYWDESTVRGPTNLTAYGPDGSPLWSRNMIREVGGTPLERDSFALMSDPQGLLTIATAYLLTSPEGPGPGGLQGYVLRLDADRTPQWLWKLVGLRAGVAVEPSTGRAFGADMDDTTRSDSALIRPDQGAITVISADGTSCRKYGYAGIDFVARLAFAASGDLFFSSATSVGRFHPVDP
jgi:hypothetical protein